MVEMLSQSLEQQVLEDAQMSFHKINVSPVKSREQKARNLQKTVAQTNVSPVEYNSQSTQIETAKPIMLRKSLMQPSGISGQARRTIKQIPNRNRQRVFTTPQKGPSRAKSLPTSSRNDLNYSENPFDDSESDNTAPTTTPRTGKNANGEKTSSTRKEAKEQQTEEPEFDAELIEWAQKKKDVPLIEIPFAQHGHLCQIMPPIRFIPEKYRKQYGRLFTQILQDINDDKEENLLNYHKLFVLNIILLTHVDQRSDAIKKNMADRLQRLDDGDWTSFRVGDFVSSSVLLAYSGQHKVDIVDRIKNSVHKQIEQGNLSKAMQKAIIGNLPRVNANTAYSSIVKKNPTPTVAQTQQFDAIKEKLNTFRPRDEHRVQISGDEVVTAIRKRKRLIAAGLGGVTVEILQSLIGKDPEPSTTQHNFINALAQFFTTVANGKLPREVLPAMRDSEVIAVGEKARPITLCNTMRKIVSIILYNKNAAAVDATLDEVQFAHKPQGMEIIIHTMSAVLQNDTGLDLLVSDATNGFNVLNRMRALEIIMTSYPSMYPFIRDMYLESPKLFFNMRHDGVKQLVMEMGVQQGDVMSTLLYSITMLELHKSMQRVVKNGGKAAAFVDDTFTAGRFDEITQVIDILNGDLASDSGYQLNSEKCMVLMGKVGDEHEVKRRHDMYVQTHHLHPHNVLIHPDDVALIYGSDSEQWVMAKHRYGVKVLGSMIGSTEYYADQLQSKLSELQDDAEQLIKFCHKQDCMTLLQWCFNAKVNHLMRTLDPATLDVFLQGFGDIQRRIVQHIVGSDISESKFERMKAPINQGGFDLGFLDLTARAAYVASLVGVQRSLRDIPGISLDDQDIPLLAKMRDSVELIRQVYPTLTMQNVWGEVAASGQTLQSKLTALLTDPKPAQILAAIMATGDKHEYVSMISSTNDQAGMWIRTLPKTAQLTMSDPEVMVALRNRFHLQQHISPPNMRCDCGVHKEFLDPYAVHLGNCIKGGGHQTIHDTLNNYIASAANHCGFRCRTEQRHEIMHTNKRPDISFAPGTLTTLALHGDVTVTNPLTGRNNPHCSNQSIALLSKSGWAAQNAVNAKDRKYKAACARDDSKFTALVFESSGYMHQDVLRLIKAISDHAADTRKIPAHILYRYHINCLSVILHRSVARAMIRRSAQLQGAGMLPIQHHIMSYDNIMHHRSAYVDRTVFGGE